MEVENHLNWTEGLINAIDYIETHLIDGEVLDQNTIARQAYSSPDNFRKVFHLITGYTIGEYIRNRRLSLAGEELISSNRTVTDIALEYGYDTPESFTKAFTRFHGNSPTYVRNNKSGLHNFTRIVLRVTADGGSMPVSYTHLTLPTLRSTTCVLPVIPGFSQASIPRKIMF